MYREHPIVCPSCGKDTGMTEEQLMYLYIQNDLCCPHCNKVVITANKMEWTTNKTNEEHLDIH